MASLAVFALMFTLSGATAVEQQVSANPIRRVVTMLQAMQKKVESEGQKEVELFDKFMCYCQGGSGNLKKSIAAAEAKVPSVTADIEAGEAEVKQLKGDLKSHQTDRAAAKSAQAEATSIREKEAGTFAALKSEADANIAAATKATDAISKGMSSSFLQTEAAQVLKKLVLASNHIEDYDREDLTSFLSNGRGMHQQVGRLLVS